MYQGPALILALVAMPALAAETPAVPLPPLVLDAAAPVVTLLIDGKPLRLRVDPSGALYPQINPDAVARLGLATPGREVDGKPVERRETVIHIGKTRSVQVTSREIMIYQDRVVIVTLAWPKSAAVPVPESDGLIIPTHLPHDIVRIVRRPPTQDDVTTVMPMEWFPSQGMMGTLALEPGDIKIAIQPEARETIATAAAASLLATSHDGKLSGPTRTVPIMYGVSRPVRDIVFARPVEVAGVKVSRAATRVYDWSGKTEIPDADLEPGEAVVKSKAGRQQQWAKLTLGNDVLGACAEIAWHRAPLRIELVCPRH